MANEFNKASWHVAPLERREVILGGYYFDLNFGEKTCALVSDPKIRFPFSYFTAFNQAYHGTFYQPDRKILSPKDTIEVGNANYMPVILPREFFEPRFQPDDAYALTHNAASYRETRNCLLPTAAMENRVTGTLSDLLFGSVNYRLRGDDMTVISKTDPPFLLLLKDVPLTGQKNSYEIWVDEQAQKLLSPDLKDLVNPEHTALYKFPNFMDADPIGMAFNRRKEPTLFLTDHPFTERVAGQRVPLDQVSEAERNRIARQEYDQTPVRQQNKGLKGPGI